MKLQLQSPENFKLTSATIEEFAGDGFEMKVRTSQSTDVHVLKTLKQVQSAFTRQYGKGAVWTEVENFAMVNSLRLGETVKNKPTKKSISEKNTDKIKEVQSSIPFDLGIGSFEVEPSEDEIQASKIKSEIKKGRTVMTDSITPIKTDGAVGIAEFTTKVNELTNLSKAIVVIENDTENNNAREVAKSMSKMEKEIDECRKMLNKPLDTAIKSNNLQAQNISAPIRKEVDRLKNQISAYEAEKERKRVADIKKIQDAKEASEKLVKAETDRIARITGSIDKMDVDLSAKIEAVRTTEGLDDISGKLNEWKPKPDYYQEFLPKVEELVVSLKDKIKLRYSVIEELEKALAKKDTKKIEQAVVKLEEIKQHEEVVVAEKINENELSDFQARQQLISLLSSIGVEDVASTVERIIKTYGSAQIAISQRDAIITAHRGASESSSAEASLKEGAMKNQRVDFTFEVIDKSKLPMECLKVDEVAIRAIIKAQRQVLLEDIKGFEISGVVIKKELTTVLR